MREAVVRGESHAVDLGVEAGALDLAAFGSEEADAMEYARLGRTGLRVSRVGLGCMSYGKAEAGLHQWTLDEDAAAPFFRQAVELGVSFWDTANAYQGAPPRSSSAEPSRDTPTGGHRAGHQGVGQDARRPRRQRPVPHSNP